MDIGSTLWPLILLKKSETLIDWCNAKGPIRENRIGYPRKWNQNWNPPTQWKVKCAFRLITGIDKLWIKRLKDVVLFGKNSFQMRENEKAGWKAIALLREIELEKLISVLTRCTWCADDCVRGSEVTYLYISGKITIPKPIFGLVGVRVKILVGNDLPRNDLPYSKGFMWFECP